MAKRVFGFFRKNVVLSIALIAAAVTSFFVPPDAEYLGYFDLRTLSCLFCTLAVICALKNINFFFIIAKALVQKCGNMRLCVIAVVYITFFGSMILANDMALLTFLPLGYIVLTATGMEKYMAVTFILQNIAANLGGMLTPFGNPQNIYLYSKFNIPTSEFMGIMLPPFIISTLLITACCFLVRPEKITLEREHHPVDKKRVAIYLVLFVYAIAIVFRSVPYISGLVIIPAFLLFLDRKALRDIDYPLLLTFAAFFVFSGNMARIEPVRQFFSALLEKNTLLCTIGSCQVISNVPSAVLLSQFTENYRELLLGVNIGGAGTLVASLASLITFREYIRSNPSEGLYYIGLFSLFNFSFVIILTLCMMFVF